MSTTSNECTSTVSSAGGGAWSLMPRSPDEITARSPVDLVTRIDATVGVLCDGARTTSTPQACRSACMSSQIGPSAALVTSTASPPRCANATAAFVAGPPAASMSSRPRIFSSEAGRRSTSCTTSSVDNPTNNPRALTPDSVPSVSVPAQICGTMVGTASLAQRPEHLSCKQAVVGSIPTGGSKHVGPRTSLAGVWGLRIQPVGPWFVSPSSPSFQAVPATAAARMSQPPAG